MVRRVARRPQDLERVAASPHRIRKRLGGKSRTPAPDKAAVQGQARLERGFLHGLRRAEDGKPPGSEGRHETAVILVEMCKDHLIDGHFFQERFDLPPERVGARIDEEPVHQVRRNPV